MWICRSVDIFGSDTCSYGVFSFIVSSHPAPSSVFLFSPHIARHGVPVFSFIRTHRHLGMMYRVFGSVMFIPYFTHLPRQTRTGFWDRRESWDIMMV